MKTLIKIMKSIINFFKKLFTSKSIQAETILPHDEIKMKRDRKTPIIYNNRKRTRGRHIQIIDIGNGRAKKILHTI